MQKRLTAKLFHTVVVLGVGLTSGCSDDVTPQTPTPPKTPTTTSSSASSTSGGGGALNDAAGSGASSSSSGTDAIPGWVGCG